MNHSDRKPRDSGEFRLPPLGHTPYTAPCTCVR